MASTLEVLPVAAEEATTAARWYFERDARLAVAFEAELTRAFEAIERAPETWATYHHGTHRFLLQRFPYEVVYKVYPEVVLVVAIAHCKRKPGYWRHR